MLSNNTSTTRLTNEISQERRKQELLDISQLIDLTDKPIGLRCDEISWAKVRSTASNCICCCCDNSVTLVTINDSYILDHVPLDNIQFAQTNPSLQYLALSNHRKIAIIDLVDNNVKCSCGSSSSSRRHGASDEVVEHQSACNNDCSSSTGSSGGLISETKVVNLAASGLTMSDIIFWRWIDDTTLAILSYEALYICPVNQQHINHPAYTAFSNRSRYLNIERVFECHRYLSALCQVTDIHRDVSGKIYAISSLYSTSSLIKFNSPATNNNNSVNNSISSLATSQTATRQKGLLKSSFGSVPSRLSQLTSNDQSFESLKSESPFDPKRVQSAPMSGDNEVCGLIQVHCKSRERSQLIQAHAITFTSPIKLTEPMRHDSSHSQTIPNSDSQANQGPKIPPTILIAANKVENQMRVHFVEMATNENCQPGSSGLQSGSPTTYFDHPLIDFPSSIVCSHVKDDKNYLHVALITTKHGQLFVCSVAHNTILFNTTITNDIISSTIVESNSQGLMAICGNGQVLLVKLKLAKLMKLLEESKTLRHISSSNNVLNSTDVANNNDSILNAAENQSSSSLKPVNQLNAPIDVRLEVLISTKL